MPIKAEPIDDDTLMISGRETALNNLDLRANLKIKTLLEKPRTFSELGGGNRRLHIVCADDTFYNLETLRLVFDKLGVIRNCEFVCDGLEAKNAEIKAVTDSDFERKYELVLIVIVDYSMPFMTGVEVVQEITSFYNTMNWHLEPQQEQIMETVKAEVLPTFCMFSGHNFKGFREFVLEHGVDYII